MAKKKIKDLVSYLAIEGVWIQRTGSGEWAVHGVDPNVMVIEATLRDALEHCYEKTKEAKKGIGAYR